MLGLRPSANSNEMRLLVAVKSQDCSTDVRTSMIPQTMMIRKKRHHFSQRLRKPVLVKSQRDTSEGVG